MPLVKPEMAGRHGPAPQVIRLDSFKSETQYIAAQLQALHALGTPWNQMAVLYKPGFMAEELTRTFSISAIPFEWLKSGEARRFNPHHDSINIITPHSSKGLEFQVVAIAGLGFMPYKSEEAAEDARLLYVGMTRATERLLLTASKHSVFTEKLLQIETAA